MNKTPKKFNPKHQPKKFQNKKLVQKNSGQNQNSFGLSDKNKKMAAAILLGMQ